MNEVEEPNMSKDSIVAEFKEPNVKKAGLLGGADSKNIIYSLAIAAATLSMFAAFSLNLFQQRIDEAVKNQVFSLIERNDGRMQEVNIFLAEAEAGYARNRDLIEQLSIRVDRLETIFDYTAAGRIVIDCTDERFICQGQ